jgi:hypothetical protein
MTGSCGEPSTTPSTAPYPAAGHWVTAREVSRESGLREDLVVRFVPTVETPNGPLFGAHQLGIARVVRQLTDIGTPASTIVAAVEELNAHTDSEVSQLADRSGRRHPTRPTRRWVAIGATAVVALVVGGLTGGVMWPGKTSDSAIPSTSAPATETVSASPIPLAPAIPTSVDPICAQWGPMNDKYRAQRVDWAKTDPSIPAAQWSPEQRSVTMGMVPGLRSEATDERALATRATVPVLRELIELRALYGDAFADRLPNYDPNTDKNFWIAVTDFGNTINSLCSAVAQPK